MRLRRLIIENAGIIEGADIECRTVTSIVGPNNSGKSTFLEVFQHLAYICGGGQVPSKAIQSRLTPTAKPNVTLEFVLDAAEHAESLANLNLSPEKSPAFLRCFKMALELNTDNRMAFIRGLELMSSDGQWVKGVAWRSASCFVLDLQAQAARDLRAKNFPEPGEGGAWQKCNGSLGDVLNLWGGSGIAALLRRTAAWLLTAHHFAATRRSTETEQSYEQTSLARDGANLPSWLATLLNNDRRHFDKVDRFVTQALPAVGVLQTPLRQSQVQVVFKPDNEKTGVETPLRQMGGGVEQLLMVASVLEGPRTAQVIFLEEPESHLHARAQRFLLRRLVDSGLQVFLTSHSSVFIPDEHDIAVAHVIPGTRGGNVVRTISHADDFAISISSLGLRATDFVAYNAIVLVEGPSDKAVVEHLERKLELGYGNAGIGVLTLGGGSRAGASAARYAFEQLSKTSPIPVVLICDKDERTGSELEQLREQGALVFSVRELENFFVDAQFLADALAKISTERGWQSQPRSAEQIEKAISDTADSLKRKVLGKRLAAVVRPMLRSSLARFADALEHQGSVPGSDVMAVDMMCARLILDTDRAELQKVAEEFEDEWRDPVQRLRMAPGEELLTAVFKLFGAKFSKTCDLLALAEKMPADRIPAEVRNVLVAAGGEVLRRAYGKG